MKQYTIRDGYAVLSRNKGDVLIDVEDLHFLDGLQLRLKHGYALLRGKEDNGTSLARTIMAAPTGMEVDHINHNKLDNRRCNLRVCTRRQNRQNRLGNRTRTGSRFKGVAFHNAAKYDPSHSHTKVWRAYTRVMGKRMWFGYYETEELAAMAYNRNAYRLFGEFACYNRFISCPLWKVLPASPIVILH
jgi:hypothetical protein